MKTVQITWQEVSEHSVLVNVPDDFDPDNYDLADALAQLENDGFEGLTREGIYVQDDQPFNPTVETLDLDGYAF